MHIFLIIIYIIFALCFCILIGIFSYKNDPIRLMQERTSILVEEILKKNNHDKE